MSGCSYSLGFNFTASAFALLLAIFGTICLFDSLPLTKTMSCCRHVVINIRITASTSVGGVASLGAGGRAYNGFICVSGCSYSLAFNFTASALTLLLAIFGTSCLFDSFPLTKTMSCCRHIIVDIGISASAGIGSVTSIGAGRLGYNGFICVSGCNYNLGFNFTTSAFALLLAIFGTICLFDSFPLTKAVTGSGYVVVNISIATIASVGGVTSFCTSRLGYNGLICVPGCSYGLGFNFTTSAFALLLTIFGTICLFDSFPLTKTMFCCRHIIVDICITASAGIGSVTSIGAGGRRGNRGILVSRRAYICICVGLAAFASMRGIAFLGTSWICYNRNIAMFFGINRFCFIFSASAGTALFTDGGAGRFQRYRPFTPFVNMSIGLVVVSGFRIPGGFRGFCEIRCFYRLSATHIARCKQHRTDEKQGSERQ